MQIIQRLFKQQRGEDARPERMLSPERQAQAWKSFNELVSKYQRRSFIQISTEKNDSCGKRFIIYGNKFCKSNIQRAKQIRRFVSAFRVPTADICSEKKSLLTPFWRKLEALALSNNIIGHLTSFQSDTTANLQSFEKILFQLKYQMSEKVSLGLFTWKDCSCWEAEVWIEWYLSFHFGKYKNYSMETSRTSNQLKLIGSWSSSVDWWNNFLFTKSLL